MTMQPGIRYIVTKDSKNKEFQEGDNIWILCNGDIMCRDAHGWMPAEDVAEATRGMEIKIDEEWIAKKRAYLEREIIKLTDLDI
ncbi:hypothetical protein [Caudoviricetes sp.]|nr:hypothetical protein [Caudoviricetes sp.]